MPKIKDLAKFLAIFSVCYMLYYSIFGSEKEKYDSNRQLLSEISSESYEASCGPMAEKFKTCAGKQVVWGGRVTSRQPDGVLRTQITSSISVDVSFKDKNTISQIRDGDYISFVGRADKKGWVYDDFRNGRLIKQHSYAEAMNIPNLARMERDQQAFTERQELRSRCATVTYKDSKGNAFFVMGASDPSCEGHRSPRTITVGQ